MFVHSHLQPSQVGAVGDLTTVSADGFQRLTGVGAEALKKLFTFRFPIWANSGYIVGGPVGGFDPNADYQALQASLKGAPSQIGYGGDSALDSLKSMQAPAVALVDITQLKAALEGGTGDVGYVVCKNPTVASTLAQAGSSLALIPTITSAAEGATKKPEGIATPLIGGLIVGAVATVVAGPVAGAAAGLGTAALIHYAA